MAILLFGASSGFGGISSVSLISATASSSSDSGVATFLRLLDRFLFDVPGGFGCNLTSGMNVVCSVSYVTMDCGGIYPTVSSIMSFGDAIATPDSATVLVLEIKITMLYVKITSTLALVDNNISLRCNRMN